MSLCNKAACVNTISAVINTSAGEHQLHQGMDTCVKYACNFSDQIIYTRSERILFFPTFCSTSSKLCF